MLMTIISSAGNTLLVNMDQFICMGLEDIDPKTIRDATPGKSYSKINLAMNHQNCFLPIEFGETVWARKAIIKFAEAVAAKQDTFTFTEEI